MTTCTQSPWAQNGSDTPSVTLIVSCTDLKQPSRQPESSAINCFWPIKRHKPDRAKYQIHCRNNRTRRKKIHTLTPVDHDDDDDVSLRLDYDGDRSSPKNLGQGCAGFNSLKFTCASCFSLIFGLRGCQATSFFRFSSALSSVFCLSVKLSRSISQRLQIAGGFRHLHPSQIHTAFGVRQFICAASRSLIAHFYFGVVARCLGWNMCVQIWPNYTYAERPKLYALR